MPGQLIEVVEDGDMVAEVYQEEDGTIFYDIHYRDDEESSDVGHD